MADLFNNNSLGATPRNRSRHGTSPQQQGEQAGIEAALGGPQVGRPDGQPVIPSYPANDTAGSLGTPSLNDLNNAQAGVTPPSLRSGGLVAPGSQNPALDAARGGINSNGTLTQPMGLGSYANNLEGFNMNRFGNPEGQGNNTWKYRVGSVLSQYAPNREGLGQAAEYLRGQGVDVQQSGGNGDVLSFGSGITDENGNLIGDIDVGRGFGAGGSGWAWQPMGGGQPGGQGQGGGDINSAFAFLQQNVAPNASKEQMEAAITQAFSSVPGFQGAYKESVNINGQWYDLVGGYGGANPSWQLMPKNEQGGGGMGFNPSLSGGNLATMNVPGLEGDPTYSQKFLEMLLGDLGI
jgi:hypothetical protein